MGRRKKGDPVHGWLVVDKPEGVTSTQVVGRARWAFNAQKAGHAGTLDPLATGLLAVAFGEATKTVPYAQDGLKTYRFVARWGEATTTDDREGEVAETSPVRPTPADIEAVLPRFTGDIMQTPPAFSAIKVDGRRAYDMARKGEEVALAARPIHIRRLTLTEVIDADHAAFEMVCGKGGYVRSMARDLALALGSVGRVETLRRVESGGFTLNGALTFEGLEAMRADEGRGARILPVSAGLAGLTEAPVSPETARRLRAGDQSAVPLIHEAAFWASDCGAPVAILGREDGLPVIHRVFAGLQP